MKRVVWSIGFFVIGFGIAFFAESFFRNQIQHLFQWTTNNKIQFSGKSFYLFGDPFYYISFGVSSLILGLANLYQLTFNIFTNIIVYILLFVIVLILISTIDANLKVMECATCQNEIKMINRNEINYALILILSISITSIPNIWRLIFSKDL